MCFLTFDLRQCPFSLMYHFYLFFIEVWLIYNVMLVSGIQQSDSCVCVCVCIYPFSDSFPLYGITKY